MGGSILSRFGAMCDGKAIVYDDRFNEARVHTAAPDRCNRR